MPKTSATIAQIKNQITTMRTLASAPDAELRACMHSVSAWSPAEHLDHLAKVTTAMVRRLAKGEGPVVEKGLTMLGRVLLFAGRIPRGKGKSPEKFRGAKVETAALLAAIGELEQLTAQLDAAVLAKIKDPVIPHPRFGGLTPTQALRFVAMHNDHHFRIIADVVRAAQQAQSR